MKLKPVLLAAILALGVSAATAFAVENQHIDDKAKQAEAVKAEKSEAEKPVKRGSHMEEKTTTPKVMQLRDWEELFGHKHTEGEANMPIPEPASGASRQETTKHMQEHDDMQEKH